MSSVNIYICMHGSSQSNLKIRLKYACSVSNSLSWRVVRISGSTSKCMECCTIEAGQPTNTWFGFVDIRPCIFVCFSHKLLRVGFVCDRQPSGKGPAVKSGALRLHAVLPTRRRKIREDCGVALCAVFDF